MKNNNTFPLFFLFLLLAMIFHFPVGSVAEDAMSLNRDAIALFQANQLEEAVALFEQARLLSPEEPNIQENLELCLNNYSISLANQDKMREAVYYFEKLRDLKPQNGAYLLNYGQILGKMGENDRALWVYLEALEAELTPEARCETLYSVGNSYFQQELYDEAIGVFRRLISSNQHYPGSWFMLAYASYKRGNLQDAMEQLARGETIEKGEYLRLLQDLKKKVVKESSVEGNFSTSLESHFIIQFDGESADQVVENVSEVLNETWREVGFHFNFYIEGRIPVIIYTGAQFQRVSDSPRWVAALFDGKIRLPIGEISCSQQRLKELIRHEFTHCLLHHLCRSRCPAWLNEGFAQIMEGRRLRGNEESVLAKYAKKGQLIRLSNLAQTFINLPDQKLVNLAYDQSFLFTRWIVEKYGMFTILEMFERMRVEDKPAQQIIEETFYKDYDQLLSEFAGTLKE